MSTSRIFHSYHLDISTSMSHRICYIILPEKLKESEKEWLDRMADTLSANMVVVSNLDWETDLTPFQALSKVTSLGLQLLSKEKS